MASQQKQPARLRFEPFELDLTTGEVYKNGRRIKLQDQPARLLVLLASRAGALVSRLEIQNTLWEDGQFVEFEHAINVAIKKIREVLEDDPVNPRIIETLPRKGYRFIAAVEEVASPHKAEHTAVPADDSLRPLPESRVLEPRTPEPRTPEVHLPEVVPEVRESEFTGRPADADEDVLVKEFALPPGAARILFLSIQVIYLFVYCLALIQMFDVQRVLTEAGAGWLTLPVLIGAACSIPVRLYLIFTVGIGHPAAFLKYRRMLPYLMTWDWLWAPSPFLAMEKFGPGLALILTAVLVYPPVSQLILMRSIYHPSHKIPSATDK